jgi:hypothetical protein
MLVLAVILVVALGLCACLPPGLPRPDPVLLLVAALALRGGGLAGGLAGLAGGLLLSCLAPGPAGVYVLVYGFVGLATGAALEDQPHPGRLFPLLAAAAGTVLVGLGLAALRQLTGEGPALPALRHWLPGALVANLLLILPTVALVERVVGPRPFPWGDLRG